MSRSRLLHLKNEVCNLCIYNQPIEGDCTSSGCAVYGYGEAFEVGFVGNIQRLSAFTVGVFNKTIVCYFFPRNRGVVNVKINYF